MLHGMLFTHVRAVLVLLVSMVGHAGAWSPPPTRVQGWSGTVEFGAQRFTGNTRSSSVSASFVLGYGHGRFEAELASELLTSSVSIVTPRRDETGEPVLDPQGRVVLDVTSGKNHERLGIEFQPRWYWTDRVYQFALVDWQRDEPAGTRRLSRQVGGAGYKFWRSEVDFLAAELGAGAKQYADTGMRSSEVLIGYVALRFVRRFDEGIRLDASFDTDIIDKGALTELKFGIGLPVLQRVSLKVRHVQRWQRRQPDTASPLASRSDGATTISLEVLLF